jgi:hypothetical protein
VLLSSIPPHSYYRGYRSRSRSRILVLPYAERNPTRVHEPAVGIGIPALIPKDFFAPVAAVRRRTSRPMQWASVPKTSVDKDSDAGRPENDIGAAP